jgi:hypothetical protein
VVVVDPHGAGPDLPHDAFGACIAPGKHPTGQAVDRIIGDRHGFLFTIKFQHAHHRPENFFLSDAHAVFDISEDRRTVKATSLVDILSGHLMLTVHPIWPS